MNRKAGRTGFRETGEQSKREMRVLELENSNKDGNNSMALRGV